MKRVLGVLVGFWVCLLGTASTEAARIVQFSPQGSVKEVRQVTARFSEAMVPFGDPRLEDPFGVECPIPGRGRWVDDKTWVYDFERDLPGGLNCTFQLKKERKSLAGSPLEGTGRFSFDTGGPSIRESRPEEGGERIDENQVFILSLDAEADEATVLQQAYCSVEGILEGIGIRLIQGPEKETLFKELKIKKDQTFRLALQCRRTLPSQAEIKLIWGRGIKSVSGVSTTEDHVLRFKTRAPFQARVVGKKEKPASGFIPLLPIKLTFSAPVAWETARHCTLQGPFGKTWKPEAEEGAGPWVDRVFFKGPFPENQSLTVHLPDHLKDDSGRPLSNRRKFPMAVKTDRYPSLAKFPSRFGIIEWAEGGLLPLTVRNLESELQAWMARPGTPPVFSHDKKPEPPSTRKESGAEPRKPEVDQRLQGKVQRIGVQDEGKVIEWLHLLRTAKRKSSLFRSRDPLQKLTLPKTEGPREFEVIGVPFREPGFYVAELESEILGSRLLAKPAPFYVPAGVLVTNLAAHFKWGRASSLVWVTSLDRGEPVAGAAVTVRDCTGRRLWGGRSDENGVARIDFELPAEDRLPRCRDRQEVEEYTPALSGTWGGLFVFARTDRDLTFTHSSWNQGIEPWRFNIPTGFYGDRPDWLVHTVLDRTLLRAGEEVHMKHYVRTRSPQGLAVPSGTKTLREVIVVHSRANQETVFPLTWRPNGTAETVFKIPASARLGTYEVYLGTGPEPGQTGSGRRLRSGSFRVEAFRVPLMKAALSGPRAEVVGAPEIEVDLSVGYLSGGGAARLPVKIRTEVSPKHVSFPDYEEATLANGGVQPGLQRFEEEEYDEEGPAERFPGEGRKKLQTRELLLDDRGGARARLSGFPESETPQDILVELEFRDPNGEVQTAATRLARYPSGLLAGIQAGNRDPSRAALGYRALVLDLKGRPLPGVEVKTRLLQKNFYSHRKRLTGGFYAYENVTEIQAVGPHCGGRTDQQGMLFCEGPSPVSGSVIVEVEASDEKGRRSLAHREFWIPGKEDIWFEARNDDRVDLLPEKRELDPGDRARFQLKMPFQEATVLVTVEREGVLDTYVRRVNRNDPQIDIPVKDHYAPNVFVSALAVRGRIPNTRPTATFDPGKPAYKLGLTEIRVGWKAHALRVDVRPEKSVYRVRETAGARIKVTTASGQPLPKGSEAAVAVVDEGLLELKPNESWKLLEAMMRRTNCDVETATAQMMVVGKRHFGRKALAQGGGGGRQFTRELFDTLLFWKGAVPLDENGEALVRFPLNDSLTSFRIVAVAAAGGGLFGTGEGSVKTTQEVMIMSGIPPLVREGDRFLAGFTVRNLSDRDLPLDIGLKVQNGSKKDERPPVRETVPAGEAREVSWEVAVPAGAERLEYEVLAEESGGAVRDQVKITQQVVPAVRLRTFQATLRLLEEPFHLEVEPPAGAVPGRGGTRITARPKLAAGLAGVTGYMKQYRFTCLEQRVSKAVVLKDKGLWQSILDDLPAYLDDHGLARYFPGLRQGSDVLTAYLLSVSQESGRELPESQRQSMLKGLKDFVEGRLALPATLHSADLPLRKLSAIEALSRFGAADPKWLGTLTIEPQRWPTSAVLDWLNILQRMPNLPERSKQMKEAETVLRSRLNLQGTLLGLSTGGMDRLWWLMATPDTNAVKTLLTTLSLEGWKEDHPKLVRGVLERLQKGRWDTTIANAWGMLALEKFSGRYETTPVTGLTRAAAQGRTETIDWSKSPDGRELLLPWPGKSESLQVSHRGGGRPWITVQSLAAVPPVQPLSSGYTIQKTLQPIEQKRKGAWTPGDVLRVRLELEAQADRTWVVVEDPIPAGSRILGSGLGRDSAQLAGDEQERGRAWEAYREQGFEALRVYYEYVPKGKWMLEYTLRLNNAGQFHLPETRVEALYSPEMFGELPNKKMEVRGEGR